MNNYSKQWQHIQNAWDQQRIPQALLLVAPMHCDSAGFSLNIAKLLLCSSENQRPCTTCNDCYMLDLQEHPDLEWIKPDKAGGAIKIDQIRELQNSAYLTPQRAKYRVIVLEGADRLNTAAANALLKILEEPAAHIVFILLAQQLATVLPTILSRCQILRFPAENKGVEDNLLAIGQYYQVDSEHGQIMQQADALLNDLIALKQGRANVNAIAAQWAKLELHVLVWFLYLVFAQLQKMQFRKIKPTGVGATQLAQLSTLLNPRGIFLQLDLIMDLMRRCNRNINVNQTLALENFLMGFI